MLIYDFKVRNSARCLLSTHVMIPQQAVTHTGEIEKGWTGYRDIAIKNLQTENIILNKCLSLGVMRFHDL